MEPTEQESEYKKGGKRKTLDLVMELFSASKKRKRKKGEYGAGGGSGSVAYQEAQDALNK